MSLGSRLKEARLKLGFSQEYVAGEYYGVARPLHTVK